MPDPTPDVVTDPNDPRLNDFTALNDPATRRRVERAGDYFVVEGRLAIERLVQLPRWSIRRLVLLPRTYRQLEASLPTGTEVLITEVGVLRSVVGFDLHRGALASVDRKPKVPLSSADLDDVDLLVVVEGVNDHENLGAIYRNAAAFGADAVILDPGCADPFYRRSVRVSLGHVMAVPTIHAASLPGDLAVLHDHGIATVALTPSAPQRLHEVDPAALPARAGGSIDSSQRPRVAIVVGAEGPGLTAPTITACTARAAIEMAAGVDSLNVATALAIALHQLQIGR